MPKRVIVFLLWSAIISKPVLAQTDVHLQVERAGRGRIPIVVRRIEAGSASLSSSADCVYRVLKNDLSLTGIFEPVELKAESDTLPDGRIAAAVFEGSIDLDVDRYALSARLLDYSSGGVIFEKIYRFKKGTCRSVAHHLSDEITYFLTGENGVATTRILFVRGNKGAKDLYMVDYDGYGERKLTEGELVVSPLWLDSGRFCYTSYKRGNPDCYIVDLRKGIRKLLSYRKGLNMAGGYYPRRDELLMTLSVSGNSELFVIDSEGEIKRKLTRNRAIDCSPTWAPNGREIAFVSDRTTVPQIYIMDAYGGNVRRLSVTGSYNTSPDWSPQGDLVAYVSRQDGLYRLKLISPDGLWEDTVFQDYLSYEDPSWAPNGSHLAVTVNYGGENWIVIVDVDTGAKRRLARGESASWSPSR